MKQNFTSEARKAIDAAGRTARYCRQNYIGTEHLLAGLLVAVQGTAAYVLQDAGVTKDKLMQLIDSLITPQGNVNEKKSNVLPAMIFDTIKQAVNTPVKMAYSSVFVRFSNILILYFQYK